MAELVVRRHGQDVPDASLVMIRISNEGGLDIGKEHWVMPVNFTFDGRDVVGVEVSDANGVPAGGEVTLFDGQAVRISKGKKALELPRIDLRRRGRIRLLVLLSGPREHLGPGVLGDAEIKGAVRGGGLVREVTHRRRVDRVRSSRHGRREAVHECLPVLVVAVNPPGATVGSVGAAGVLQHSGANSATFRATRTPSAGARGSRGHRASSYNALVDYLLAAIIFVFIVTVLVVLWKREHPRKD